MPGDIKPEWVQDIEHQSKLKFDAGDQRDMLSAMAAD